MHRMTIIGRLGQDPEMRYTPDGTPVTSFSLASENPGKDRSTVWVRVSAFGKQAEMANEYLNKGQRAYVEGPFQLRSYTAKDGSEKFSLDLTLNTIQFLGGSVGGGDSSVDDPSDGLPF